MHSTGTTNYRLSKALCCSPTTVANWLGGAEPGSDKLQKIAGYFDVSVDYLLGKTDEKKPLVHDDEELTEYLEELKNRSEMRMLFKLSKGATKEEVEQAVKIIEALRK